MEVLNQAVLIKLRAWESRVECLSPAPRRSVVRAPSKPDSSRRLDENREYVTTILTFDVRSRDHNSPCKACAPVSFVFGEIRADISARTVRVGVGGSERSGSVCQT